MPYCAPPELGLVVIGVAINILLLRSLTRLVAALRRCILGRELSFDLKTPDCPAANPWHVSRWEKFVRCQNATNTNLVNALC